MNYMTYLFDELNDGVSEEFRTSVTELLESHESRIWVPEYTMTITIMWGISALENFPEAKKNAYPGTTCPLFKVFHRNSLMISWVISPPISFCMLSCHRSTS